MSRDPAFADIVIMEAHLGVPAYYGPCLSGATTAERSDVGLTINSVGDTCKGYAKYTSVARCIAVTNERVACSMQRRGHSHAK